MWKSKSFWTGIAAVGFGIVLITQGDTGEGVQTILGGLGMIFIRAGLEKNRGPNAD